jgi:hypothetical protein
MNRGYKYFQLNRNKQRKNYLIHQWVAKLFIGERTDSDIDHIDRNKLNNNVENLRYVSRKENLRNTDRFRQEITTEGKQRKKELHDIWVENNRERYETKRKEYRKRRSEELNENQKKYYEQNKETRLLYAKQYREKNKNNNDK